MSVTRGRRAVPDRSRKRAIRALAAELGVAYSVAARLLEARTLRSEADSLRPSAGSFRPGADEHRAWMFAAREQRSFLARVTDTRLAADLPIGRATHLTRRFPPVCGVDPRFHGEGRETTMAMLYGVLLHESPGLRPAAAELSWAAELGEESAVDVACAALDRAARLLLDTDRWRLWARVETALTAGESSTDRRHRDAAILLGRELRTTSLRGFLDGARHTLDALLVEPYQGHPPGTRLPPGTVVSARWTRSGPPVAYDVCPDGSPTVVTIPVLPG
ncbi:hypothetical protein [Actinoplanes derwentensis]|uniref:Uncharacterized protein n=1 Tax=Actinoplanes derwentensis TaxID=113562 RepID=A0A1H1YVP6_9ACTN|nr:hypothetical protein [Actinoplanes derwentensis]GID81314.1 hypothetical protein Ade03nite_02380 [Actinoplanes derwentensis]SDT25544.1 hypothetical protein SAMN04489716_3021 [Actinoplanes derwentensis]